MLRRSTSKNRRPEAVAKLRLAARMAVVAAVGVWVVYQLGLFVGSARLEPAERLKLGRRGLALTATTAEGLRGGEGEEMGRVEDYAVDEDEGMDLEPPLEEDEPPDEADEGGNSAANEPGEA